VGHTSGFAVARQESLRFRTSRLSALRTLPATVKYVTVGNLKHDGRAALFLMDYPNQARHEILGRAEILEGPEARDMLNELAVPGHPERIERAIRIHLEAFDWNCQQHMTPHFTPKQIS
jgi:uncharacterized protein